MAKFGVLLLMVGAIAILSYLIYISFKLLRKAENERKAELPQKPSKEAVSSQPTKK